MGEHEDDFSQGGHLFWIPLDGHCNDQSHSRYVKWYPLYSTSIYVTITHVNYKALRRFSCTRELYITRARCTCNRIRCRVDPIYANCAFHIYILSGHFSLLWAALAQGTGEYRRRPTLQPQPSGDRACLWFSNVRMMSSREHLETPRLETNICATQFFVNSICHVICSCGWLAVGRSAAFADRLPS